MGRRKNAPQKKYAGQFARTENNKLRHFIQNGSTGTPPKARRASGGPKVVIV